MAHIENALSALNPAESGTKMPKIEPIKDFNNFLNNKEPMQNYQWSIFIANFALIIL